MANSTTKQVYLYQISMAYINGSEKIDIVTEKIRYIVIMHDYETSIMPKLIVSVSLETDIRAKLLDNQSSARIYLKLQKYNAYSSTSSYSDYIEGNFVYILSSMAPEYGKSLADSSANDDSEFQDILMGLLDIDILNSSRKTFNGIFKNVNQTSLMYYALQGTKAIVKVPTHSKTYSSGLIVKPLSSRKAFLDYIFDTCPFYDTDFTYFIDFNTSYLLDKSGTAVKGTDGQLTNVIIDVHSVVEAESYNEGMQIKNNAYYLYINPKNIDVSINKSSEKLSNQIVTSTGSSVNQIDLDLNSIDGATTKQEFIRTHSSDVSVILKNRAEANQIVLTCNKALIDSKYLTPNKAYTVTNYDEYAEYNGSYILSSKREVIQGSNNKFVPEVTFTLRKVGNIQSIGSTLTGSTVSSTKTTTTSSTTGSVSSSSSSSATTSSSGSTSKTTTSSSSTKNQTNVYS